MGMKEDGPKRPNKKLLYYYGIILLITILLNALVMPALAERSVTEVTYDQFLDMLDNKQIAGVTRGDNQLTFWTEDVQQALNGQLPLKSWKTADIKLYKTGLWPDEDLTARLRNAGITFSESIPTQASPLQNFIFNWVLPILMFVVIGQILSKSMAKRMGGMGNAMTFGKSNAKIYAETETGKTFADVAGQEEAKEALKEIVDFLHNPQKYADIGAVLPKGALLVGPPGTGKTLLAKAVAGEAHVPFFSISGSEFVEMFVGMGAAKVRDLFKQANEKAPCIVFIDEIDTIGKKRDGSGFSGNDEREQTLNQLLTEMDGFDGRKGVVILAATNRPESLDKALLRPGRFDRRIPVELPDLKGRVAILKVHARKIKASDDVDFHTIARMASGASGAELANIVNEAALRAVRDGRTIVTEADLEESIEVVIAGYQKKNAVLSDQEKKVVSYHEIGHALVAALQNHSAPVQKITIIPRTSGALGYTMQVETGDKYLMTKKELEARNEVKWETYTKKIQIEARVLGDLAMNHIIPVATQYQTDLINNVYKMQSLFPADKAARLSAKNLELIEEIADRTAFIKEHVDAMIEARKVANKIESEREKAIAYHDTIVPALEEIRYHIDKLELIVDNQMWTLPKYRELLFVR